MQARLQLRWEALDGKPDEFGYRDWKCSYELYLPLDEYDIRREDENYNKVREAQILEISTTKRGSRKTPCINDDGGYYFDPPYRDASHALWDSKKLGDLPIVCIAIDGTVIDSPEDRT